MRRRRKTQAPIHRTVDLLHVKQFNTSYQLHLRVMSMLTGHVVENILVIIGENFKKLD